MLLRGNTEVSDYKHIRQGFIPPLQLEAKVEFFSGWERLAASCGVIMYALVVFQIEVAISSSS